MEHNKSEVARLMRQITEEYEAAKMGMNGPACGSSRHRFINKRMEQIGHCHEELIDLIGRQQATSCMVQALEQARQDPDAPATTPQDEQAIETKEGPEDGKC